MMVIELSRIIRPRIIKLITNDKVAPGGHYDVVVVVVVWPSPI